MKYLIFLLLPFILFSQNNSGCTDSLYQEYSYLATTDDGSCQTLINCENDCSLTGDVNCNGVLDGTDAFLISQWIVGLYNLPCEQSMSGLNPDQLQEIVDLMQGQLNINYTGSSGGNCDYGWPEGKNGEPVLIDLLNEDYVVPEGKHLYITSGYNRNANARVKLNGALIFNTSESSLSNVTANLPIAIKAGDILSAETYNGTVTAINILGILIDQQFIDPVCINLLNEDYVVPEGKHLYITSGYNRNANARVKLNGALIFNTSESSLSNVSPNVPINIKSGDILSAETYNGTVTAINIVGYLVDENYFANCSAGGGSSSLSNTSSNNASNMITPSDINLICKDYIVLDNLYSSNPIYNMSIDNEGNVYVIHNEGTGNMYNTVTTVIKYDSLFNIVWEINNPGVDYVSGIKFNEGNNKLYVAGKLGGYWPVGSSFNWSIGTYGTGNFNGCEIQSGYGFVAEINPADGTCNWASPVNGSSAWYLQDPLFTFNDNYLCFLTQNSNSNSGLILSTFDITNGELIYSGSGLGISGQAGCVLSDTNELFVKNGNDGYLYNIFDGSYNSSNSYNSGSEENNLLISSNGELLTFYNTGNNYYMNSQVIGESGTTQVNGYQTPNVGSGDQFAYKTSDGYSLCIGYSELEVLVWNQLYVNSYSNNGKFMILDLDENFNITKSYNISAMTSLGQAKYAASSNGSKCLFVRMENGNFVINGDEYSGVNNFLIFFD